MTKRCSILIRRISRSITKNIDDRFTDSGTGADVLAENIVTKNIILSDDTKMRYMAQSKISLIVEDIKQNSTDYGIGTEVHILDEESFYASILKCVIQSNIES